MILKSIPKLGRFAVNKAQMKKTFFIILAAIPVLAFAQYGYRDANRIGIIGGINQFTLTTDNFPTKAGTDWNAGLSVRGNFYNDFDMVYAMQFSENRFTVPTHTLLYQAEQVEYTLPSAQISLMLSYKFIENHLSAEIGPVFQIGDKFHIDDDENKTNLIDGTTLRAGDILGIGRFNFYPAFGITFGVRHFRLNGQYQYGVTNMLGKLNGNDLGEHFKGNASILSGNLIIYL